MNDGIARASKVAGENNAGLAVTDPHARCAQNMTGMCQRKRQEIVQRVIFSKLHNPEMVQGFAGIFLHVKRQSGLVL